MARQKKEEEPAGDVPVWFMTYSDVITLLMTFFILLLTFATDEPEKFERVQVSLFGGGGATGIAGDPQGPLEQDAFATRFRPHSGRITTRGSEMPPESTDPILESAASGLAGLDSEESHDPLKAYEISVPMTTMVTSGGDITMVAKQRLRMLARQLKHGSFNVTLQVCDAESIDRAISMASHLIDNEQVLPGKIGVSVLSLPASDNSKIRIIVQRQFTDRDT